MRSTLYRPCVFILYLFICFTVYLLSVLPLFAASSETDTLCDEFTLTDFFPKEAPQGWSAPFDIQMYGTADNPSKNGTIFDYINGGGVVYVDHGLRELAHVDYSHEESGSLITIDIFDMGSPANAAAVFSDGLVCPDGHTVFPEINNSKVYHYAPDYFMYFQNGRFLVYINVNNDMERETAENLAAFINRQISREEQHETSH